MHDVEKMLELGTYVTEIMLLFCGFDRVHECYSTWKS